MSRKTLDTVRTAFRQKPWAVALTLFVVYSAALFYFYAEYYFADLLPVSGDALVLYSDIELVKNAVLHGEFPLWNKFLAGGIPFTSTLFIYLIWAFLPIKGMVYATYISFVALGAAFSYLYFEKIGCGKAVSVCMSVCYLFSVHLGGFRKSHVSVVFAVALLPVMLYLVEMYFSTRKLRWLLLCSAVMAVQFAGGHTQYVVYTDLFLAVYLICFGCHYRMKWATMLRHGAAWGFTYIGLCAFRMFPVLEQSAFYSGNGAVAAAGRDVFESYSISPIKLIQTIFPRFWGEDNFLQPLGLEYSSEMDIELFLGHMVVLFVLGGLLFLFRDFRVRFAAGTMAIACLYAAAGTVPWLSDLFYHVPIFNSFRCPARALYLFIFSAFTLAALALSHWKEDAFRRRLCRLGVIFFGGILGLSLAAAFSALFSLAAQQALSGPELGSLKSYLLHAILPDCVGMALCAVLCIVGRRGFGQKRAVPSTRLACALFAALTLVEVLPYSGMTAPCTWESLYNTDPQSIAVHDSIGNGKVWDAFLGIDGAHESIVSQNMASSKEIPALNSFVTFNDPRLYRMFTGEISTPYNFSGLFTGTLYADRNVWLQNPLLSMLGVKYLIDSSGILQADASCYRIGDGREVLVTKDTVTVPAANEGVQAWFETFDIEQNAMYEIKGRCTAPEAAQFSFDLYGGPNYDNTAQQIEFSLDAGEQEFSGIIATGSFDRAQLETVYWRFMSTMPQELTIRDFTLSKVECQKDDTVYRLWNETEGQAPIYLNTRARDILYVPERIETLADTEELYSNVISYPLDTVDYVQDIPARELAPDAVTIANIDFGYNRCTADIQAGEDTFVNFSQVQYPGWNAYVNGQKTPIHLVNGLIMGIEVPAGSSRIEFVYRPTVFWIGLAVSGGTFLLLLVVCIVSGKKRRGVGR